MYNKKLETLADIEGTTIEKLLETAILGESCKGICLNKGCNYTTEVEPDQHKGYCENCGTQSIASACVLAGII